MHVDPQIYDLAEFFVREHHATAHLATAPDEASRCMYLEAVAALSQQLQVVVEDWFADLKIPQPDLP